jgi:hypothetical protein
MLLEIWKRYYEKGQKKTQEDLIFRDESVIFINKVIT